MKSIFVLLTVLSFLRIGNCFAIDRIQYNPNTTTKIVERSPHLVVENKESGYMVVGNIIPKDTAGNPEHTGIFLLNLNPSYDIFILNFTYYKELYLNDRPITVGKDHSKAIIKDDKSLVLISCIINNQAGEDGDRLPCVMKFNNEGELLTRSVDSLTDTQNNQTEGPLCPILLVDQSKFIMFNYAYNTVNEEQFYELFASNYDMEGNLTGRQSIIKMKTDTIGSSEGVEYFFEPISAISDNNGGIYLYCNKVWKYSEEYQKRTGYLMLLDENMQIVNEKEFAIWDNDLPESNKFINSKLYNMILNSNNELLVHVGFDIPYKELTSIYNNNKVSYLNKENFNEIKFISWSDSVNVCPLSIETMSKELLFAGYERNNASNPYFGDDNLINYSVFKSSSNVKQNLLSIHTHYGKTYANDYFAIAKEHSFGEYYMFGSMQKLVLFYRIMDSDFLVGIEDAPLHDGTSFGYSSGNLLINTPHSGMANIKIFDVLGNKVFETEKYLSGEKEIFRLGNMNNGVFIVSLEIEGEQRVGKIIVGD